MEGGQQAQYAIPLSTQLQLNGSKNCSTFPPELLERCFESFIKISCHFNAFCGKKHVTRIPRKVSMLLCILPNPGFCCLDGKQTVHVSCEKVF